MAFLLLVFGLVPTGMAMAQEGPTVESVAPFAVLFVAFVVLPNRLIKRDQED